MYLYFKSKQTWQNIWHHFSRMAVAFSWVILNLFQNLSTKKSSATIGGFLLTFNFTLMNTTTPTTIAIPGEKRNGQQVKQFLRQAGLIWENDINLEVISVPKIGIRFIQMRARESLNFLERWLDPNIQIKRVDGVITWIDQMREYMRWNEKFDDKDLVWFFKFWSEETRDWLIETDEKIPLYDIPFILDDQNPTKIQLLVPQENIQEYKSSGLLNFITRSRNCCRGIATSYPTLTKKFFSQFPDEQTSCYITEVWWKIEALVGSWFYSLWVDVVDTGESAKRNWLIPTKILYKSYPAGIFSASQLEQDKKLQDVVQILTDASNNAYYNSPNYRNEYPRG